MSVRTNELDNPERGQAGELNNRGPAAPAGAPAAPAPAAPRGAEQVAKDIKAVKEGGPPPPTVDEFKARLESARELRMPDPHCSHCAIAHAAGRDQAIAHIASGG